MTLLVISGLAFASCNSDNNSDEDMDSLVQDTSMMSDGTIEATGDTSFLADKTVIQTDTSMTDSVPIQ